jgi:hypothetical protein
MAVSMREITAWRANALFAVVEQSTRRVARMERSDIRVQVSRISP